MKFFFIIVTLLLNLNALAQSSVAEIAVGEAGVDKDKFVIDDPELKSLVGPQKSLGTEFVDVLRNDFVFYNRNCDLCKRNIISIYSPDNEQIIYCNKCWWSDDWDPKSYAKDFDFSRSFFEQFKEFRTKIPALALFNDNNIYII